MEDEGPDAVLPEFKPTNAELHYRDPMCYRDMLSSVQAIELQKVKKMILECIVYSIQTDGSVSKHMRDHKFVSSTMSMTNGDRHTVIMVMYSPEERGAHGLLETVNQALKWDKIENVPHLPEGSDIGCKLSVRLRKLLPLTDGTVQKVLAAIGSMSPHSMQTERIVSHHNIIVEDSRTNMTEDTIKARLLIALNGVGTAHYDPRPAVAHFLSARERRN
eukprot:gene5545-biopygen530